MRNLICIYMAVAAGAWAQVLPVSIPIAYDVETAWMELPAVDDPTSAGSGTTYNVYPFSRALRPGSGEILGEAQPDFGCDPADLRRYFRLEKTNFLLGEPILVEYRVELDGPGRWSEWSGGNYRSRGRDDNFYFLLRREDGSWVEEVQPFLGGMGGGLGGGRGAEKDEPASDWQAVQRWCAITAPGKYELYCFNRPRGYAAGGALRSAAEALLPKEVLQSHSVNEYGRLIDSATGDVSTRFFIEENTNQITAGDNPLLSKMPAFLRAMLAAEPAGAGPDATGDAVIARSVLGERKHAIQSALAYARFPIEIRTGTDEERAAMVEQWRGQTGPEKVTGSRAPRERAIFEAIHYSLSEDFLPLIVDRVSRDSEYIASNALERGLLLMASPDATAILLDTGLKLEHSLDTNYKWGSPLTEAQRRVIVSNLIGALADSNAVRRARALSVLRAVAGGWFLGDERAPLAEPSLSELIAVQPKWWDWFGRQAEPMTSFARGIWGYIDRSGATVIEPQFTHAGSFRDGVAYVSQGNNQFPIDATGNRIKEEAVRWGEGPYPVLKGDRWGYESAKGEEVLAPHYGSASAFWGGRAVVRLGNDLVVIDAQGQVVFGADRRIQHVHPDGTMTFALRGSLSNLHGLLDRDGNQILPPVYESIGEFSDGLVRVGMGSTAGISYYGYADRSGEIVIPPNFANALPFSEGLAAVTSGTGPEQRWGYIDKTGVWVIEAQFRYANSFADGLAAAADDSLSGGGYGYIDTSGAWVIRPQFKAAQSFSEGLAPIRVESPYRWLENPQSGPEVPKTE